MFGSTYLHMVAVPHQNASILVLRYLFVRIVIKDKCILDSGILYPQLMPHHWKPTGFIAWCSLKNTLIHLSYFWIVVTSSGKFE